MKICYSRILFALRCVVLPAICVAEAPAFAQPTFQGQTMRFVIGGGPGGPLDIWARQFVPFISNRLPGKPTFVVENRPGAASAIAANYIFGAAKPDGHTIGYVFGIVTTGLIGGEGIRFDPAKFRWIGALSTTQVVLARKDLKIRTPRDLLQPTMPLVLAAVGAGNEPATIAKRLFLDLIGAKYKLVAGYPGLPAALLALNRNEANLVVGADVYYVTRRDTLRAEGIVDAVLQRGDITSDGTIRRNKQFPDLPTMAEGITELNPSAQQSMDFRVYQSILSTFAIQQGFVVPPATPTTIVDILRKAVREALDDPDTHKAALSMLKADYEFVDGAASQKLVEKIAADYVADASAAARLRQLTGGN